MVSMKLGWLCWAGAGSTALDAARGIRSGASFPFSMRRAIGRLHVCTACKQITGPACGNMLLF